MRSRAIAILHSYRECHLFYPPLVGRDKVSWVCFKQRNGIISIHLHTSAAITLAEKWDHLCPCWQWSRQNGYCLVSKPHNLSGSPPRYSCWAHWPRASGCGGLSPENRPCIVAS